VSTLQQRAIIDAVSKRWSVYECAFHFNAWQNSQRGRHCEFTTN